MCIFVGSWGLSEKKKKDASSLGAVLNKYIFFQQLI